MKSNMRITMNDLDRGMLQHNKLPDLALDKLMEWIMSGKLSMGDKLNTEELASQLGCRFGKLWPILRRKGLRSLFHMQGRGL